LIDVAADEKAKEQMKAISGKALVPQVHVNGKFKGVSVVNTALYWPSDNYNLTSSSVGSNLMMQTKPER
jgi:glutaredoxin-related protein